MWGSQKAGKKFGMVGTGVGEPEVETLGMLEGRRDVGRSCPAQLWEHREQITEVNGSLYSGAVRNEAGIPREAAPDTSGENPAFLPRRAGFWAHRKLGKEAWKGLEWVGQVGEEPELETLGMLEGGGMQEELLWEHREQMAFPWITLHHQGYLKELPKCSSRALENRVFQE